MRITVLTIFPDQFESFLNHPLIRRAIRNGILELSVLDLKTYVKGSFRHIDDSPYGGGNGMILRCEPVFNCLGECRSETAHLIAFTPSGRPYTQQDARRLSRLEDLILLCGHYEGFDQRILDEADEEISVGDYVLSGGELPAMTVIDSIVRLLEGTLREGSSEDESFEDGLLEYPQYTRPRVFEGKEVPEVLLSGHTERIRRWRKKESLRATMRKRPDLLETRSLNSEEKLLLEEIEHEQTMEGNLDQ